MSKPAPDRTEPDLPAVRAVACDDGAAACLFVHDLLRRPDRAGWQWLEDPATAGLERRLRAELELRDPPLGRIPASLADYETEFIAAFEAGVPQPPIPLIESHYDPDHPAPEIIYENLLYYRTFGLAPPARASEAPDHLRCQLELVAHLYELEAKELRGKGDFDRLGQLRRGRRDYVARHLRPWLEKAAERALGYPQRWVADRLELAWAIVDAAGR